jgi:hypothetical protein
MLTFIGKTNKEAAAFFVFEKGVGINHIRFSAASEFS